MADEEGRWDGVGATEGVCEVVGAVEGVPVGLGLCVDDGVSVNEGVGDPELDGCCVWLGVCGPDALVVSDGVTLGVWLVLPEDVGVGDGEQTSLRPISKIPRNGAPAVHVIPASVLVQLARTLAAPPENTAAAPTLYHDTASDAEITSAHVVPRIPDVSKTIGDSGKLVYAGAEGMARDGTTDTASP